MDFFPLMGCSFETFIRRDLIVRVRFGKPHVLSPHQNEHSPSKVIVRQSSRDFSTYSSCLAIFEVVTVTGTSIELDQS
jgi:hypothetical protein